jgi:hypothetical protein
MVPVDLPLKLTLQIDTFTNFIMLSTGIYKHDIFIVGKIIFIFKKSTLQPYSKHMRNVGKGIDTLKLVEYALSIIDRDNIKCVAIKSIISFNLK